MSERLKNILQFAGLAPGASVVLPHDLHTSLGTPLAPDIIFVPDNAVTVTSDAVNVTVTNDSAEPQSGALLVESWHTIERAFGDEANKDLPVKPYIVVGSGELIGIGLPVVFRPGDPAGSHQNVFVTWDEAYAALQSVAGRGNVILEFDDQFSSPCVVPPGVWKMDDVTWTHFVRDAGVAIELADGASIVCPVGNTLRITGYSLGINSDRKGPIAPFVDLNVICDGFGVGFQNTDPAALPMFVTNASIAIFFTGSCSVGAIGPVAAPLIDIRGQFTFLIGGGGHIDNNAVTDTLGGGVFVVGMFGDVIGGGDTTNEYFFPALFAAGGLVETDFAVQFNRHLVFSTSVTAADSPHQVNYNEIVLVDSTTGPVTILAPAANPAPGERMTVKDIGGNAAVNNITISPMGPRGTIPADTVESGSINTNFGSKTWVCDTIGNWWLL